MAVSRLSQQSIINAFPKGNTVWDGTTATSAFDSLGSVLVSTAQSNVTFSNIPQTYTHLHIRVSALGSANNDDFLIQFNNITASSNYSWHEFRATGAAVAGSGNLNQSFMYLASNAGDTTYPVTAIVDLLDYTNTNKPKTIKVIEGKDTNGGGTMSFWSGLYFGTNNAISTIKLYAAAGNFNPGTSIALYGVK